MSDQFTSKGLARGTKLTTQHFSTPLTAAKTALQAGTVQGLSTPNAPFRATWVLPYISSRAFETQTAKVVLPFAVPTYQELWQATFQPPEAVVTLTELVLSFDQRAEPWGITDPYSKGAAGWLSGCDMSRYTTTLQLVELPLSILDPTPGHYTVIGEWVLDGQGGFGNPFFRANPVYLNDLSIPLHPYRAYAWMVSTPGLYKADKNTYDQLAMPNLTISAKGLYPLTMRDVNTGDQNDPTVQNLPMKHQGNKNTGTLALTLPSSNTIINGDTDLQAGFSAFDQVLLDKLNAGYGASHGAERAIGQEADASPWEQVAYDAGYSMIVVPLWNAFEDVRAKDVPTAGLPYTTLGSGYTDSAQDRRLVRIPDGFTLHHVLAGWNVSSPPAPVTCPTHVAWGTLPASATFVQKVGVGLCNGLRGDDYAYQQVAYLEWDKTTFDNYRIAHIAPDGTHIAAILLNVPLVAGAFDWDKSYTKSGPPVFMGAGNSTTQERTYIGAMPTVFGGFAFSAPATKGGENFLEIRWDMADAAKGLDDGTDAEAVRIGYGGNFVILVGKQATVA